MSGSSAMAASCASMSRRWGFPHGRIRSLVQAVAAGLVAIRAAEPL